MQAGSSQYQQQLQDLQRKLSFDDPINIQFTSVTITQQFPLFFVHLIPKVTCARYLLQGTTGAPKGATLSHHNIINDAYFVGKRVGYDWRVRRMIHHSAWIMIDRSTDQTVLLNPELKACDIYYYYYYYYRSHPHWNQQNIHCLNSFFLSLTLKSVCLCHCTTASGPWAEGFVWPSMASPWSSPLLGMTERRT